MRKMILILSGYLLLVILAGCGGTAETSFDAKSGTVDRNHELPFSSLRAIPAGSDGAFERFYVGEQILFLGESHGEKRALLVRFRHALDDNRFKPAERDFGGFYFDGQGWRVLAYTRARHDSTSLLAQNDYYFGSLQWNDSTRVGTLFYDRDNLTLGLEFANLLPLQAYWEGETRLRAHAVGDATLRTLTDTVSGTVFCQLEELADYNPLAEKGSGIDKINYDWVALLGSDNLRLLAASDSATVDNRLYKNFLAVATDGGVLYADGSDNFRIESDLIRRDAKIFDYLALKKSATVPELGFKMDFDLSEKRFFYTSGFALAIVTGEVELDGQARQVWGVLEHQQRPKADPETLK
ncbi:MAG: hypothetical protein ABIJ61_04195 [bacterium]